MQYLLSRIDWLFGIQRCLPPQGEVSVVRELDIYPWRTEKDLSIIMLMFERMIKIILDKIHYEFRVLFSEIEEFMVDNKIDKNIEEVKMLLIKFNCFLVLEHPKYDEIKEMVTCGLDEKYGFEQAVNCYLLSLNCRFFTQVRNEIIGPDTYKTVDREVIRWFINKFDNFAKFDVKYRMQY